MYNFGFVHLFISFPIQGHGLDSGPAPLSTCMDGRQKQNIASATNKSGWLTSRTSYLPSLIKGCNVVTTGYVCIPYEPFECPKPPGTSTHPLLDIMVQVN